MLVLVFAALLSGSGCDRQPAGGPDVPTDKHTETTSREPRMSPPTAPPSGVAFTATVSAPDGRLTVAYEIVNQGEAPVVVFNGLPHRDSPNPGEPVPEAFYVLPEGADGVRLTKQVYGLPENVSVYAPMVLRGTVVPAGGRTGEHVVVGRLRARRPYQDILGHGKLTVPDPPRSVRVCVGVALAEAVHARSRPDDAHPVYAHDTATAAAQYVFCANSNV